MQNQLFGKLFSRSSYVLEDFATEVLTGILRSEQALLDDFVNNVLKIQGKNFSVETQKNYGNLKVDIIFVNKDSLCFLQSKVDSFVETRQLEQLKNVLNGQSESSHVYLRYCTKYYADKSIKGINFDQFRWEDIYVFLKAYSENPLIREYIDFLEENKMDCVEELKTDELEAIEQLPETIRKMDVCLDSVAAEFTELFDIPTIGAPAQTQERLQDLLKFKQYHMTKAPLLQGGHGEWGWSDVRIGFTYIEAKAYVFSWYWCGKTHAQHELLKTRLKEYQALFTGYPDLTIQDEPQWLIVLFKKPLADFNKTARPLQAIHNWFIEHMRLLKQFSEKTPELNWNLPDC